MGSTSHSHKRFPEKYAFLLNNRFRRFLNPPDRLLSTLNLNPGDVVVDFGCGPGYYTIPLAMLTGRAIGIDVSPGMLKRVASNAKKHNVTIDLIKSDGTSINLEDGIVDLILLVHVFHEIEEKGKVLSEFRRVLKGSGRMVIVERTRGGAISRKIGPPVMDEQRIATEIGGFKLARTIQFANDSIFVCNKYG
jgi:ubiquinone/menaquinone biosynthesis C-methylase UbiE